MSSQRGAARVASRSCAGRDSSLERLRFRRAKAPRARYSAPATFAVLKTMEVLASTAGGAGSRASSRKRVRFWGAVWIDSARMVSPYSRAARRPAIAAGCGNLSRATRGAAPAVSYSRTGRRRCSRRKVSHCASAWGWERTRSTVARVSPDSASRQWSTRWVISATMCREDSRSRSYVSLMLPAKEFSTGSMPAVAVPPSAAAKTSRRERQGSRCTSPRAAVRASSLYAPGSPWKATLARSASITAPSRRRARPAAPPPPAPFAGRADPRRARRRGRSAEHAGRCRRRSRRRWSKPPRPHSLAARPREARAGAVDPRNTGADAADDLVGDGRGPRRQVIDRQVGPADLDHIARGDRGAGGAHAHQPGVHG